MAQQPFNHSNVKNFAHDLNCTIYGDCWRHQNSISSDCFLCGYVEFYDFTMHSTGNMFLVTGREKGFFEKGNTKIDLAIRTSRVFIKKDDEWKQIQHHGSIDNPDLLRKYQNEIMNKE